MNKTATLPPSRTPAFAFLTGFRVPVAGAGILLALWWFAQTDLSAALLFAIGLGLGACLFLSSFGFSAAWRKAIVHRDMSGALAMIFMIALATLFFAPLLATQQGRGAWAPAGLQVAIGAFIFGIGMQIGGACASGTLFSVGGGSPKMLLTLIFFCAGAFLGSLHLGWWAKLPDWGTISLGHQWGWSWAVLVQLTLLGAISFFIWHRGRGYAQSPVRGLLIAGFLLAALNAFLIPVAGHPWSITWAFSLWGAKTYSLLGGDLSHSGFWSAPFQANALNSPLLEDTTSLMNIAVIVGAFVCAFVTQRLNLRTDLSIRSILASLVGGLLMGYGARLAYGCNIGALFSGMASTSLHAWIWLFCALPGTWVGIKLRPVFGLRT